MVDLLADIDAQAALYEAWTEAALKPDGNLTSVEMAFYRMHASGVELLKPLLIWLHEPGRHLPQDVIDSVIAHGGELGDPSPAAAPDGCRPRPNRR